MEVTVIQKPTAKELITKVWSNKHDAIFAMAEQAKKEARNKYLKTVTYGRNDNIEYSIVNLSEIIDVNDKCYIANYINGILTVK